MTNHPETTATTKFDLSLPPPPPKTTDPQVLADYTIQKYYLDSVNRCVLRHFMGRWYKWKDTEGRYIEVPEAWIASELYNIHHPGLTMSKCRALMDAIAGLVEVYSFSMPVFLEPQLQTKHSPDDIVGFANGFLDVTEYLSGNTILHLNTPHWFSLESTSFDFDPQAVCPRWLACLDEWFGQDQESKDLLQEWFGYCLTSDTSAEKMLLIMGAPGTGKSTAMLALQYMLGGADRVGSSTIDSLNSNFGLQPIVGKSVVQLQEVRSSWAKDNTSALQKLISIVGRDPQYVDRKHSEGLSNVIIKTKFMMASNLPPKLPDNTGAFLRRLLVLDFDNGCGVPSNPDPFLKEKLKLEAEGILIWALSGLERLRKNRMIFTIPAASANKQSEIEDELNPLSPFVKDCLTFAANTTPIDKVHLYDYYCKWNAKNCPGTIPHSNSVFFRHLRGQSGGKIKETRVLINGSKVRQLLGVAIRLDAPDLSKDPNATT